VASRLYRSGVVTASRARLAQAAAPLVDRTFLGLRMVNRRFARRKAVLLLGDNLLMLQVLGEIWETVADVPELRATVAVPRRHRQQARRFVRGAAIHLRVSPWPVRARWWDLVIVADHTSPFHPRVQVVRAQHGMAASVKRVHGEDYTYGRRRCVRPDGTPVYTRMLESSELTRDRVVRESPELAPVVVVVGNLRLDHVRAAAPAVQGDGRLVIGYMSTFGPHSLLAALGESVVRAAEEVNATHDRRSVLFTHPNLWRVHGRVEDPWDDRLADARRAGVIVIAPDEDPAPWLRSCDVVVSDHTSLSLAAAGLGLPIVFLAPQEGVVPPGSPTARLIAASPTFTDAAEMTDLAVRAAADGQSREARAIVAELSSHPGEAPARVRAVLLDLLQPIGTAAPSSLSRDAATELPSPRE
jgi:hypothetical protein